MSTITAFRARPRPPLLDVGGYFTSIQQCRERFPELTILTGIEFGQPHRYAPAARASTDLDRFDRVLGSLHTLPFEDGFAEPVTLYRYWEPHRVVPEYLLELERMARDQNIATVVTHLDYAIRTWPESKHGPFDPHLFETEIRGAMVAIAQAGLALEINTRSLRPWIPRWWIECGGTRVTFGSDAHTPEALAHAFPEAVDMVATSGFRPGELPRDPWVLS